MDPSATIVEPYEIQDVTADIDLSGYHYDMVPTYKMIEDTDDQDTLFRIQFIQAFGIIPVVWLIPQMPSSRQAQGRNPVNIAGWNRRMFSDDVLV